MHFQNFKIFSSTGSRGFIFSYASTANLMQIDSNGYPRAYVRVAPNVRLLWNMSTTVAVVYHETDPMPGTYLFYSRNLQFIFWQIDRVQIKIIYKHLLYADK